MLNSVLTVGAINRAIEQVPSELVLPFGGPWDARIRDVDAEWDELTLFDRDVATAADLLAPSATSRDVTELPPILALDRAFRIKQSSKLTHTDIQYLTRLARLGGRADADDRGVFTNWLTRKMTKRLQGVAIRRGLLKAGLAQGSFTYDQGGYKIGPMNFDMPAEMQIVPPVFWQTSGGNANTNAKPVDDINNLRRAAINIDGGTFNAIDMPYSAFIAMVQTDQYKAVAQGKLGLYSANLLPVQTDEDAPEVAGRVLGLAISIEDRTFSAENTDGSRTTSGRYMNEDYAVLFNTNTIGNASYVDFGNAPITEEAIARIAGKADVFGGRTRGPLGYATCDQEEFSWARLHATQEGTPRRWQRTVTARITQRGG